MHTPSWFIHRDYLNHKTDNNEKVKQAVDNGWHRFRLYDDDGELYYEGYSKIMSFGPLAWAREYAGCTEIKYKNNLLKNNWITL